MARGKWFITIEQAHRTIIVSYADLRWLHRAQVHEVFQVGVGMIDVQKLYPRAREALASQIAHERAQRNALRRERKAHQLTMN